MASMAVRNFSESWGASRDTLALDRRAMAAPARTYDVFISYSRKDARRVAPIRDRLAALGLSVFLDVEGIDGGAEFTDVLDHAVKNARVVLALWTHEALERRWVRIESRIGLDRGTLVAAAIEPMRLTELPAELYNVNVIDLADFRGQEDHPGWEQLLRAIGRKTGRIELTPPGAAPATARSTRRLAGWKELASATCLALAILGGAWQGARALDPGAAASETRVAPRGAGRLTQVALAMWLGDKRGTLTIF